MKKIICSLILLALLVGCQYEPTMVSSGLDDTYVLPRMKALMLHPEYEGERYEWSMPDRMGNDSIVATTRDYTFVSAYPGVYRLTLRIIDAVNPFTHDMIITVWNEEVAYSRYIAHVYEYVPAPGQFIGRLPYYDEGDSEERMRQKVEESIKGTNDDLVSLGGFGGYITFGFDHSVVNVPDSLDFKISGNAFYSGGTQTGGAAEPGIVMVSFDSNGNGTPDDEWYELAGSEHDNEATIHHYTITYHAPTAHEPVPGVPGVSDAVYIAWEDNQGGSGYIEHNVFNTQEYFPQWLPLQELTFTGTCLPHNGVDNSGTGNNYVLSAYEWGYADNHPNDAAPAHNCFDIDWAVDCTGNHVSLPCIDFVRVYTGINQQCGRIGETSTEICRAEDLHIEEDL